MARARFNNTVGRKIYIRRIGCGRSTNFRIWFPTIRIYIERGAFFNRLTDIRCETTIREQRLSGRTPRDHYQSGEESRVSTERVEFSVSFVSFHGQIGKLKIRFEQRRTNSTRTRGPPATCCGRMGSGWEEFLFHTYLNQIVFGVEMVSGRFYDLAHRRKTRRETTTATIKPTGIVTLVIIHTRLVSDWTRNFSIRSRDLRRFQTAPVVPHEIPRHFLSGYLIGQRVEYFADVLIPDGRVVLQGVTQKPAPTETYIFYKRRVASSNAFPEEIVIVPRVTSSG